MADATGRITVTARLTSADEPFRLELGGSVAPLVIAFETYGTLDRDGGNAVLVCHALTGSAGAAGRGGGAAGWWEGLIGPGRPIDTSRYFVISTNVLGGCYGSTGPNAIAPESGTRYGGSFPAITIRDMVRAQRLLLNHIGVQRLRAVIGGSMGGMQALEWGLCYPDDVDAIVPIATSAAHSAWCVAFNAVQREALELGAAAGDAEAGLRLARKAAMISYRSAASFARRFGRDGSEDGAGRGFAVERWLEHHGRALEARFDPATYAVLSAAMDRHDVARGRGSVADALARFTKPALVVGISSDVLYPPAEQRELARLLPGGRYRQIDSPHGHDAFLIDLDQLGAFITEFLDEIEGTASFDDVLPLHTNHGYQEAI